MATANLPNVVTSREFEVLANEGNVPKKVAFILNTNLCEPAGDIYSKACEEPAKAEKDEKKEGEEEDKFEHKDMEGYQHLPMSLGAVSSVVALKQAGYVREKADNGLAYIFYDNMIVQGIHERYYKAAQDNPGHHAHRRATSPASPKKPAVWLSKPPIRSLAATSK